MSDPQPHEGPPQPEPPLIGEDEQPAEPRPAATVILLRRGGRHRSASLELLIVERAPTQSFMPGVWVFPGGAVDSGEDAAACAARELHEEAAIDLGPEPDLRPWIRWVTPEVVPVRFDTVFFVGLAPPHSAPRPDRQEVSAARWISPRAALDENAAGELKLAFPTIKTLETLLPYATADEAIAAATERTLEPILPRVVGTRSNYRILLPGDPEY